MLISISRGCLKYTLINDNSILGYIEAVESLVLSPSKLRVGKEPGISRN